MISLLRAATAVALVVSLTTVTARPATEVDKRATKLPTIDLGYVVQRATIFNETGQYYNFSNIRYARPPTGELRFRAPQPPLKDRSVVRTGEIGRICPQANPAWLLIAEQFIPEYLLGKTVFSPTDFNTSTGSSGLPAQDPRTTEDCLFLDVQVPKAIFDKRNDKKNKGAPVLVWIYGGGYTAGSKGGSGNPAGLLARSEATKSPGVVYVALNYRLGAFGWLSGPTFQEDGTANVGLYDQRLAIEWVKQNIKQFGGDPTRITLIGESAGGGSIMHQITAFGGSKPVAFQQAISQSPGFQPFVSTVQQENIFNAYLTLLNISTIEQARKLPYQTLQTANIIQVGLASAYGQFTYGPVVDGIFAPQLPGQLLAKGQFAKNVNVMVGHNADEGLLFTSPYNQNDSSYDTSIETFLPTLPAFPQAAEYITNTLYPSSAYPNQIARVAATIAEASFTCNTYFLDKAFRNQTHSYFFAVPPALHGNDVAYTFYNGPSASVPAPKIAVALQEYITRFAETGNPGFPVYGKNASMNVLDTTGITLKVDDTANVRCEWWQKALYY